MMAWMIFSSVQFLDYIVLLIKMFQFSHEADQLILTHYAIVIAYCLRAPKKMKEKCWATFEYLATPTNFAIAFEQEEIRQADTKSYDNF